MFTTLPVSHAFMANTENGVSQALSAGNGFSNFAADSDAENAQEQLPSHLTSMGLDRTELVRIIAQSLRSLGYVESATHVEEEAGVEAMSTQMRRLRECVLGGRWDELEGILDSVTAFKSEADAKAARFVLYEQKFLELLEAGQTAEALSCLRNNLTQWSPDPSLLHRLPLLHMCTSAEEVRQRAKWPGAGLKSRSVVLEKLHKYIPPTDLLQEKRLENLLCQALEVQKRKTMFPYTKQAKASLLEDMEHDRDQLPQKVLYRLAGHTDEVWYVQFSHNGQYLASASKDATVIVWDWARLSAGEIRVSEAAKYRLEGHDLDICFLSWAPNDLRLLTCGSDHTVRLWDTTTGQCNCVFRKHKDQVMACVWMPHGRTFFSGSNDKQIIEWDVATGESIATYDPGTRVMDLALSTDGSKLVCCGADKNIHVFDTSTRMRLHSMREDLYITSCCLADDGESLLVNITSNSPDETKNVDDTEIHIWNINEGVMSKRFKGFQQCRYVIRGCFGGHDQIFVLCGSEDKHVCVWERYSGDLLFRLEGHTATVNSVSWSPTDPHLFASGSDDKSIIVSCSFHAQASTAVVSAFRNQHH